jgi:hypothetical protein
MRNTLWLFPLVALASLLIIIFLVRTQYNQERPAVVPHPGVHPIVNAAQKPSPTPATTITGASEITPVRNMGVSSLRGANLISEGASTSTAAMLRIFGKVEGENATPVSGAVVSAAMLEIPRLIAWKDTTQTTTSLEGKYELFVPPGRDYAVYARATGYAVAQRLARGSDTRWREIEVNFSLVKEATISGIVKDVAGKPVGGATISPAYQRQPDEGQSGMFLMQIPPDKLAVKSGQDGRFLISGLYNGVYTLAAKKVGYNPVLKMDVPSPSVGVEIILAEGEGGVMAGGVYYFADGRPAEGATVSIRSEPFTPRPLTAETNALGEFRFQDLNPGLFEIGAEKEGLRSIPHESVDLRDVPQITDVALKLFDGYIISGKVYEQGGLKTLANVKITVRAGIGDVGLTTVSDEQGGYSVSGIFNRVIFIGAELEGYFQDGSWGPGSVLQVQLPSDRAEVKNTDITMSRGVRISGRAITSVKGNPIPGADIRFISDMQVTRINRQPISTSQDGRFEGYVHNHSRLTVRASHKDYADASSNPISVSDQPVDDIEIRMGEGGRVSGVVLTPDEPPQPVPGARVQGYGLSPDVSGRGRSAGQRMVVTDNDGHFVMEKVPSGTYYLSASADNYSPSQRRTIWVQDGGEVTDVKLILTASHFIEGKVVYQDKEPVAGAVVTARSVNGRGQGISYSVPDGRFRVDSLRKGRFTVSARKGSEISPSVEVDTDAYNVELVMGVRETSTLLGRVVDAATGDGIKRFTLRAERGRTNYGEFTSDEGRFRIDNLVRGRTYHFIIESSSGGYVPTLSPYVNIPKEGDPPEVIFQLGGGGSILGKVISAKGNAPVDGAKVTWVKKSVSTSGRWGAVQENQITYTNNQGVFLFESLSPEGYRLRIEKVGYPELIVECAVKNGEVTDLGELVLTPPATIRGTIFSSGEPSEPAGDMLIRLERVDQVAPLQMSYKTGPDGTFVFNDLPAGKYRLSVVAIGGYITQDIQLAPGDVRQIKWLRTRE